MRATGRDMRSGRHVSTGGWGTIWRMTFLCAASPESTTSNAPACWARLYGSAFNE